MGEEPALADAKVAGQALKRHCLQAFRRADAGGVDQDRLPGPHTTQPAPVGRLPDGHLLESDISTNGRLLLTYTTGRAISFEEP